MQRRDYLERMIEQLAAAIAQVLGLAREQRFDEAEQALDAAWSSSVTFRRADAARLDDATLRMLLGPKVDLAASLFEAEAGLAEARGETARAEALRARASVLRTATASR
jgi:hypothetical protein